MFCFSHLPRACLHPITRQRGACWGPRNPPWANGDAAASRLACRAFSICVYHQTALTAAPRASCPGLTAMLALRGQALRSSSTRTNQTEFATRALNTCAAEVVTRGARGAPLEQLVASCRSFDSRPTTGRSLRMTAAGLRRPAKRRHFFSSTSTYSASITPSSFFFCSP